MDSMDPLEPLDTSRKHVGRRHHFRRPGIAIKFSPLDDGDAAVLGVDVLDGGGSTDFGIIMSVEYPRLIIIPARLAALLITAKKNLFIKWTWREDILPQ